MSTTDTDTPINNKKQQKSNNSSSNSSNWQEFGKMVGYSIIIAIIWSLIGSNFIYFMKLSQQNLDLYFPTNENKLPYAKLNDINLQQTGGNSIKHKRIYGGYMHGGQQMTDNMREFLNKIGFNNNGFPYNLSDNVFSKYFKEGAKYSYISGRTLIKKSFDIFKGFEKTVYFIGPIIFTLIGFFIPLLFGVITTIIGGIMSNVIFGLIISLFLMILVLPWAISIGLFQQAQFIFTFLFLPFFTDYDSLSKIFINNLQKMSIVFGILVIYSAISTLNKSTYYAMILSFLFILIYS